MNAPSTEATSAEVTTNLRHLSWSESACSMHTLEVQHLNQQQSIYFHSVPVMVTGNKAALAPSDGKLDGEGESWSFSHSKNCGGKNSAFASNANPSGAGVMQLLTKSDSGTITFAGLETPNSSGAMGSLRPVQLTSINGFSGRLCIQTFLKVAVPILKD